MAIKKSELYSSLWQSCDQLRGSMDASQYKDYVLVLLFIKYISDKYRGQPFALIEVPEGGSFADMVKLKGDKEIGDKMNKIIAKLAEANELKGVIDVADFNNPDKLGRGKEMVDRLSNLIAIFENPALDFGQNRAEGDDILGDAYEYLMRHFATESGKSKGQFYTPAEVSRIMAQVIGIEKAQSAGNTLYDPTCGSGSLLLKAADEAPRGVSIYGQELDNATAALAKMNMILHDTPTAEIWQGNTLADPHFLTGDGELRTFDYIVANPPFSYKAWSNGFDPENDLYGRFEYGIPPSKNGDYAFLLHVLRSLNSSGTAAIIMPHGVLFRGNVEAEIRKNIIQRGYIKGIIGLPANLFYGTGIPACIIVLDKKNAATRQDIFMIDASKGFVKDGNKNRLRHQDIHKIVDVFTNPRDVPKYARIVPVSEIEANDYNLNIPRYIDTTEPEDIQDIEAHLQGGIPNRDIDDLEKYWRVFPTLKHDLFESNGRNGYSQLKVDIAQVRPTIFAHHEFQQYDKRMKRTFESWTSGYKPHLQHIKVEDKPKLLISTIAEALLTTFADDTLIDKYDVYQHLMRYWQDTMQDDVYMLVVDGWKANEDLIPRDLLIRRYFEAEQKAIDALEAEKDDITRQIEELDEEHGGEDGLLSEVQNDKGKVSKGSVTKRIKEIKKDPEAADELTLLNAYTALLDEDARLKKAIKDAQATLDEKITAKYGMLTEGEVQTLVVDDKWLTAIASDIQGELDRVSQTLTSRIKQLAERYATPLSELEDRVDTYSQRVAGHLRKMGYNVEKDAGDETR